MKMASRLTDLISKKQICTCSTLSRMCRLPHFLSYGAPLQIVPNVDDRVKKSLDPKTEFFSVALKVNFIL